MTSTLMNMFDYSLEDDCRNSLSMNLLLGDKDGILPPEPQEGNVEYKLKLINPSPNRLQQLVTQMKWRLEEGNLCFIDHLKVNFVMRNISSS